MRWQCKNAYIWYLYIRRHFCDVIIFFLTRNQFGRHVYFNYLPSKIKFGIFRLKLANKLQESPDRHRLQWS